MTIFSFVPSTCLVSRMMHLHRNGYSTSHSKLKAEQSTPILKSLSKDFCNCTNRFTVSVSRSEGTAYHYVLDEKLNTLKPLNCSNCQPKTTGNDLFPIYSTYHHGTARFVIVARNVISDKTEQFVYNPTTETFEQVDLPDLAPPVRQSGSDILCTISTENSTVVIRKNENGLLKVDKQLRDRHYLKTLQCFEVKTLAAKESTNSQRESEKPIGINGRASLSIQYDVRTNQDVVFVHLNRKLMSVQYYDYLKGEFQLLPENHCLAELYIFPKYAVYSDSIKKHVIHARNGMTGKMEQFVYSQMTRGFEQVVLSAVQYNPSIDMRSDIVAVIEGFGDVGTTIISKDLKYGSFCKHQFNRESQQYEKIPPADVRFISMKQEELERQMNRDEQEDKAHDEKKDLTKEALLQSSQKTINLLTRFVEQSMNETPETFDVKECEVQLLRMMNVLKSYSSRDASKSLGRVTPDLIKTSIENLSPSQSEDSSTFPQASNHHLRKPFGDGLPMEEMGEHDNSCDERVEIADSVRYKMMTPDSLNTEIEMVDSDEDVSKNSHESHHNVSKQGEKLPDSTVIYMKLNGDGSVKRSSECLNSDVDSDTSDINWDFNTKEDSEKKVAENSYIDSDTSNFEVLVPVSKKTFVEVASNRSTKSDSTEGENEELDIDSDTSEISLEFVANFIAHKKGREMDLKATTKQNLVKNERNEQEVGSAEPSSNSNFGSVVETVKNDEKQLPDVDNQDSSRDEKYDVDSDTSDIDSESLRLFKRCQKNDTNAINLLRENDYNSDVDSDTSDIDF